jgi:hypothetical protein
MIGAPVLAIVLAGAWEWGGGASRGAPAADLSGWELPQLVEHLNAHGMGLRVVSVTKTNAPQGTNSAFLTTTKQTWSDLTHLLKVTEKIDTWAGTLYCERLHQPGARALQIELWGDCCLVVGPFLFFGDRELLARASAILHASA